MIESHAGDLAQPVTTRHPFYPCGGADQHYYLLEVAEGIPAVLALEHSVRILHAAYTTFSGMLEINPTKTQGLGSVLFQIEIAKALLNSVIEGFSE